MRVLIAAAMLTSFFLSPAAIADPLHKSGNHGEWRHAESGWIFPIRTAGFDRVGRPYTLDGNSDVGGEYAEGEGDARKTALVDLYLPDTAAAGATLEGAKAALVKIESDSEPLTPTEAPFSIPEKADVTGVKLTVVPKQGAARLLYFFTAPNFVVTVRATVPAADAKADASIDEFVRAMRWDTLGVFDDHMHSGGT